MRACLSRLPRDRPTFVDMRQKLQRHISEDYYLNLESPYSDFNSQIAHFMLGHRMDYSKPRFYSHRKNPPKQPNRIHRIHSIS